MTAASTDLSHLEARQVAAIRRALKSPKYELIPLKNVLDQLAFLPPGSAVAVTASPSKGMAATIDLSVELKQRGFEVIPHLSARLTTDRGELVGILGRLDDAGIDKALVVGGDTNQPGEFVDGLSLLTAMEEIGHGLVEIGVPAYPEGHPLIRDVVLQQALEEKAPFTSYITTQMCFVPDAISSWVYRMRDAGVSHGVYIGVPGVADMSKLLQLSIRIGVGESRRFLTKNKSLAGKLARPGGYSPDDLISGLGELMADPVANILGFHVYTFNQVESTEQWRHEMLERLG